MFQDVLWRLAVLEHALLLITIKRELQKRRENKMEARKVYYNPFHVSTNKKENPCAPLVVSSIFLLLLRGKIQ